jgi:HAD superfamily hydrolase (TIGR01509 family)
MMTIRPDQPLKLVCFDLDGTIANTEPLHDRAKAKIAQSIGYTDPIDHEGSIGKSSRIFWASILTALGKSEELYTEMDKAKEDMILQIAAEEHLPPSEGLRELLAELAARGIPASVCTSSTHTYAVGMLEVLGLTDAFSFIVGGDEVTQQKPAPDIYRASLRHFGVDAASALAVEDTTTGAAAAKAAGLRCIGYKNPTSGNQDLSQADWQISSMRDAMLG